MLIPDQALSIQKTLIVNLFLKKTEEEGRG